jgi:hypothetical protein
LKIFSFYIVVGNIPRIPHLLFFQETKGTLITEFLLYFVSLLRFILNLRFSYIRVSFLLFSIIIVLSSFHGALLKGFHYSSTLYAIRLIFIILSGIQVGEVFYNQFQSSIEKLYKFISSVYFIHVLLGFVIYFVFRKSIHLWAFLESLGFLFKGDPHSGRFVSTYLDPNYFSAIALIPFIAMYRLNHIHPSFSNQFRLIAVTLSIILAWSRSGIATFLFIITYFIYVRFLLQNTKHLKLKWAINITGLFIFVVLIFCIFRNEMGVFFYRLIHLSRDESALARVSSFSSGIHIIFQHPFGIGYNYSSLYNDFPFVDSSILNTFITFGSVFSFLILILFVLYLIRFRINVKKVKQTHKEIYFASKAYHIYLLFCILFASQFNNLLYYQYWLIPIISLFTYFSLCFRRIRKFQNGRLTTFATQPMGVIKQTNTQNDEQSSSMLPPIYENHV